MTYAIAWIATAIAFAALDAVWLSQAAPKIYRPLIGEMLADNMRIAPAIAFYLIYVTGIVFFAVAPALERGSLIWALLCGAALGFVAYATYDLSNHATLKVWDVRMTLIDMAWGTFASAVAAGAGFLAAQRFG
ncbi:MAG: DUF2177 family protein [Phycisphaerales bacterium]|nr:DUF2177 family protein [Hyphomonadaceae bacterium]